MSAWAPSTVLGLLLVLGEVPHDDLPAVLAAAPPPGLGSAARSFTPGDDGLAALGRALFFDARLSRDGSVACASCHQPAHGFADPRPLSVGVDGRTTARHAPTLFNRALGTAFMWDGRAETLEAQVLQPIENPLEMDLAVDEAVARIAADDALRARFHDVLGRAPDRDGLAAALAEFVRRLWIGDSPFDRFRAGDVAHLDAAERAGFWLYESRGGCWRCHSGANFSDESFHNTGVGAREGVPEEGRFAITGDAADRGAFKTPTLRGLTRTAPYMHDGSLATLRDVVEYYRRGGNANDALSPLLAPLELSDADVDHLVAFLECLSEAAPGPPPTEPPADSGDPPNDR